MMSFVGSGDSAIFCDDLYGGSISYIRNLSAKLNYESIFVDMTKPGEIEKAIKKNTKIIWLESPTNPTLKITDIKKAAEIGKKHKILTVVDNTFASALL